MLFQLPGSNWLNLHIRACAAPTSARACVLLVRGCCCLLPQVLTLLVPQKLVFLEPPWLQSHPLGVIQLTLKR